VVIGLSDVALTVRSASQADGDFVASLSATAFAPFACDPARAVRAMMRAASARSFIAELEHGPWAARRIERVGVAVRSVRRVARGSTVHLDAIAVIDGARRLGVGRSLLAHVERDARERHAASVSLMTAEANAAARRLFEDAGFLYLARRAAAYRGAQVGLLMLKPLW
jgi:ribosomal protein S18 acetylase RimI-like enzyme